MGEFCGADLLWGPETAELVKSEMRRSLGGCPCELGGPCSLLPRDMAGVMPSGAGVRARVKLCRTLEFEPQPRIRRTHIRAALASVAAMVLVGAATLSPASAQAGFGPDWSRAMTALGIRCTHSDDMSMRTCWSDPDGERFTIHGCHHESGDLYVSDGPEPFVMFVFNKQADADRHARQHDPAAQYGRAVIW